MSSQKVLEVARAWVGREFRPGQLEQCANFVRTVFREAGLELRVARRPVDWEWTSELAQGPDFANSFFSDEVGQRVEPDQLEPGDLIAFRDTYQGDFPPQSITHVGIYMGGGRMIDRATGGEPVRQLILDQWWYDRIVEGRRPTCYTTT